jgi:ribosomal protein S9
MVYTLGQAAKAAGKSKTAIANAIETGRLSATKDAFNRWQIDPSELHRVYPAEKTVSGAVGLQVDTDRTGEIERLKATVEGLERLCQQIEGERDSLRDQNTRLTALLTDQRARLAAEAQPEMRRRWWQVGRRTTRQG